MTSDPHTQTGITARLTAREVAALLAACHFALDDDPPGMPTSGPLVNDMRRALAKLKRLSMTTYPIQTQHLSLTIGQVLVLFEVENGSDEIAMFEGLGREDLISLGMRESPLVEVDGPNVRLTAAGREVVAAIDAQLQE